MSNPTNPTDRVRAHWAKFTRHGSRLVDSPKAGFQKGRDDGLWEVISANPHDDGRTFPTLLRAVRAVIPRTRLKITLPPLGSKSPQVKRMAMPDRRAK